MATSAHCSGPSQRLAHAARAAFQVPDQLAAALPPMDHLAVARHPVRSASWSSTGTGHGAQPRASATGGWPSSCHARPRAGTATLVAQFVTAQMLTMPQPLRQALAHIHGRQMYRVLGGPAPDTTGAAQPRLWLLALAPIAASYEDQMTGTDEQRSTWRTDRYSPCPRADAGAWLRFLAQAGHQLSPIEQAVADGVPYQGEHPATA